MSVVLGPLHACRAGLPAWWKGPESLSSVISRQGSPKDIPQCTMLTPGTPELCEMRLLAPALLRAVFGANW